MVAHINFKHDMNTKLQNVTPKKNNVSSSSVLYLRKSNAGIVKSTVIYHRHYQILSLVSIGLK